MQWLLSLLIVTCLCTVKWEGGRERRGWGGRGGSDVAKKKKKTWSDQMFCSEKLKERTVDGSLKNKFKL